MKIEYVPAGITSFRIPANETEFKNDVREHKKLYIEVRNETKTQISLGVGFGINHWRSNITYENCPFKLVEKDKMSFLSGDTHRNQYFKISKKQQFPELLIHIENVAKVVLDRMCINPDEITLVIPLTSTVRELKTT